MPKSKRSREVALTKTDKRATREHKSKYIQEVRETVDAHSNLYLFSYENMRSNKFQNVRLHFRDTDDAMTPRTRIFLGKNKLLQLALGRTAEEEYADNLRNMAKRISGGSVGLLCTSQPHEEVVSYFESLEEPDFARAGAIAPRDIWVSCDDIAKFPVSMMEQLRKLGLPVETKNGQIFLRDGQSKHRLCREDEVLSAEKCKLLTHFDVKLAHFKVSLVCRWSNGEFEELA